MAPRTGLAVLLAAVLGACAEEPVLGGTPETAKACQVRPCRCLSASIPLFFVRESVPVRWRENGDAYCPEGFVLVLSEEK
jgi:hypothetical protein